ncbi:hypothetical protein RND71_032030 [Anisodus tanguticus]|uniref:Uncharacterized protein n=1 Tax=Anisodus tanguticus TaxID=243964 RepID=A0AAE1RCV4_9SOLA|nr:hypothetical protein RND71_032030 [Anisodus tanguticus]
MGEDIELDDRIEEVFLVEGMAMICRTKVIHIWISPTVVGAKNLPLMDLRIKHL